MISQLLRMGRGLLFITVFASPLLAGLPPLHAPELDPGSMASAITLLVGGLLILKDRRAKR
jgi:hypothetical protein